MTSYFLREHEKKEPRAQTNKSPNKLFLLLTAKPTNRQSQPSQHTCINQSTPSPPVNRVESDPPAPKCASNIRPKQSIDCRQAKLRQICRRSRYLRPNQTIPSPGASIPAISPYGAPPSIITLNQSSPTLPLIRIDNQTIPHPYGLKDPTRNAPNDQSPAL